MLKTLVRCVLATSILATTLPAVSQEIVHALTGTVSAVSDADRTITLFQDGGSQSVFKVLTTGTRIAFDKKIAGATTAAKGFQTQGAYVILFYFGGQDNQTAVAVKSLGAGPFSSTSGEVTKWNGHDHTISVKGEDGSEHSYKIGPQTVAETYQGAVDGLKFDADKGDQVRLVSTTENGTATVLFIRQK